MAHHLGGATVAQVSAVYHMHRTTLARWIARALRENQRQYLPRRSWSTGTRYSLTRRTAGLIPLLYRAQPNLRLEETRTLLRVLTGEATSTSALGRELRRQGLTRKRL